MCLAAPPKGWCAHETSEVGRASWINSLTSYCWGWKHTGPGLYGMISSNVSTTRFDGTRFLGSFHCDLQTKHMGVSENSVPLNPMVLLIIIPIKWLFHWEYTLFSDKPISKSHRNEPEQQNLLTMFLVLSSNSPFSWCPTRPVLVV